MPSRRRSRHRALQILFQWDVTRQPVEKAIEAFYYTLYSEESEEPLPQDLFMEQLVKGAVEKASGIDERLQKHSAHWRLERMSIVDRNILRLAVYEMLETATPAAVAIDEALELARRFSGDDSVAFINGVLDAVRKELPGNPEAEGGEVA
jgi:N utilization substance protein B